MRKPSHRNSAVKGMRILAVLLMAGAPLLVTADVSEPSMLPTYSPSPTSFPSDEPSVIPSDQPSITPTDKESMEPSSSPSSSMFPSDEPSSTPTVMASEPPTMIPSSEPSISTSPSITTIPSNQPSISFEPSMMPSSQPSVSTAPSMSSQPSNSPSLQPSSGPSITLQPSLQPSVSTAPSMSSQPSNSPSLQPSSGPSITLQPSLLPTIIPSLLPTTIPSGSIQPSITPTSSSVPSFEPSNKITPSPTAYDCDGKTDTTDRFYVEKDFSRKHSCDWVGRVSMARCFKSTTSDESPATTSTTRELCPITCGLCSLAPTSMPSPEPSLTPSRSPTSLPTTLRPSIMITSTPPSTGPSVTPTSVTSTGPSVTPTSVTTAFSPSTVPTVTPPVAMITNVSIEIGPIAASEEMNNDEKLLFESIAKIWIEALLASNTPEITLRSIQVVNQRLVVSSARRLQGSGSSLVVDVEVSGEFQPTQDFMEMTDIGYDNIVKGYFRTQKSRSALLNALKESSYPSGIYFDSLNDLGLSSGNRIVGTLDKNEKKNISDNEIIIIAATVSGGAIIVFAVAVFIWSKKGRNSTNGVLGRIEEDVEADIAAMNRPTPSMDIKDMGGFFSDITTPKQTKDDNINNWEAMTPQVPEPPKSHRKTAKRGEEEDIYDDDDDATDGSKSQRTFNTLEKIYSNESENASYQSYGYSLEDGLKSKASVSPGTVSAGTMKMDLYGLNASRYDFTQDDETLEVSVGSPGTVNSGLTYDDASKVAAKHAARGTMQTDAGFIRVCQAPPGKLGVIIDTTKNGPVVHQVKAGSPLEGIIYAGDRIISIDEIDTRGMTASNVTKIMAKKCDVPRKITVSSKTYQGNF